MVSLQAAKPLRAWSPPSRAALAQPWAPPQPMQVLPGELPQIEFLPGCRWPAIKFPQFNQRLANELPNHRADPISAGWGRANIPPPPSLFPAPLPEPPFGSLSVPVCCITPGAPCTPPSFPFGVCPNALPAGHPHSQKPRSRLATGVATRSSPRWPLGEPSHQQVSWRGARWQPGRRRLLAGTGRGAGARGNLPGTPRPGDAAPAPCPALPPYKGLAPTRGARVSACPGDKESGCQGCC